MGRVELESALRTRIYQTKYVCILYSGSVVTSQHALYLLYGILRMRKPYAAVEVCPTQPRPCCRLQTATPPWCVTDTKHLNAYGDI